MENVIEENGYNWDDFDSSMAKNQTPELSDLINSLCTPTMYFFGMLNLNMHSPQTPPSHLNQQTIQQIVKFHHQVYNDILNSSTTDGIDYDLVQARLEDQIYFKYKIEFEDIAAFIQIREQAGNLSNPALNESDIRFLKQSTSALLKLNQSYNPDAD